MKAALPKGIYDVLLLFSSSFLHFELKCGFFFFIFQLWQIIILMMVHWRLLLWQNVSSGLYLTSLLKCLKPRYLFHPFLPFQDLIYSQVKSRIWTPQSNNQFITLLMVALELDQAYQGHSRRPCIISLNRTLYAYSVHVSSQIYGLMVWTNKRPRSNLQCSYGLVLYPVVTVDSVLITGTHGNSNLALTGTTQFLCMTFHDNPANPEDFLPSFFRWKPSGHLMIHKESQWLETIVHRVLFIIAQLPLPFKWMKMIQTVCLLWMTS